MTTKVSFTDETLTTADELAVLCGNEFSRIDERFRAVDARFDAADRRFDQIDETIHGLVTKAENDAMYRGIMDRFDDMDARMSRFEERMDAKFDSALSRMDSMLITLRDHEGRIDVLERASPKRKRR